MLSESLFSQSDEVDDVILIVLPLTAASTPFGHILPAVESASKGLKDDI